MPQVCAWPPARDRMSEALRTRLTPSSTSLAVLALLTLLAAGCGPRPEVQGPDGSAGDEVIDFDTTILVREGAGEDEVVSFEASELFAQASAELKAEDYVACARHFDALWRALPDSEYFVPGVYNAGLCLERQERWEEAAERYLELIARQGDSRDGLDAYFRLAEVDANVSRWDRVVGHMRGLLARDDLRHLDRMEAHYRAGMALLAQRRLSEAESMFKDALRENLAADRARLPDGNYFMSGCTYGRALVYHFSAQDIAFRLPQDRMKTDMQTRIALGRQAYDLYVRTIRQRHPYWSLLSGYMVGKLFEDFYYAVLASEIPHDLNEDEMRGYMEGLREELDPLLDQALSAWEKTSAVSERIGFDNDWTKHAEERMTRLRTYRTDEATLRAEEEAILEWNRRMAEYRQVVPPGTLEPVDAEGNPLPLAPEPPAPKMPLAPAAAPE